MDKLIIENIPSHSRYLDSVKITGFQEGELVELKSIPHAEAKQKLLNMLDERNQGTGSYWHNGYGIYGLWFDNEAAYMNIGNSCD